MVKKPETKDKGETKYTECGYGTCGAVHDDCPHTWKGTCDRDAPHDGSHHCSSCNSSF
jgi:hypothetical protein